MVVIKSGGKIFLSKEKFYSFIQLVKNYSPCVVVFGAGEQISSALEAEKIPFKFYKGERVTTPEMLEIIRRTFNRVAEEVVTGFAREKIDIAYIEGTEIFTCKRKSIQLGSVGEVTSVNTFPIKKILSDGKIALVSPLGSKGSKIYNVNADAAATSLAVAVKAEKLIFYLDVGAVLADGKPLAQVSVGEIEELISSGVVDGGMIPKVKAAAAAIAGGVGEVEIGSTKIKN